jgi:hypothetical protein
MQATICFDAFGAWRIWRVAGACMEDGSLCEIRQPEELEDIFYILYCRKANQ